MCHRSLDGNRSLCACAAANCHLARRWWSHSSQCFPASAQPWAVETMAAHGNVATAAALALCIAAALTGSASAAVGAAAAAGNAAAAAGSAPVRQVMQSVKPGQNFHRKREGKCCRCRAPVRIMCEAQQYKREKILNYLLVSATLPHGRVSCAHTGGSGGRSTFTRAGGAVQVVRLGAASICLSILLQAAGTMLAPSIDVARGIVSCMRVVC